MGHKTFLGIFVLAILNSCLVNCQEDVLIEIEINGLNLKIARGGDDYIIELILSQDGKVKLSGQLGVGVDLSNMTPCLGLENCISFGEGNKDRLHLINHIESGIQILWTSKNVERTFTDCFKLNNDSGVHWYGGPERIVQDWPLEKIRLDDYANVPQEKDFGAVTEPYWLNSLGAYVYVDQETPLFIDQNNQRQSEVCFSAKMQKPFRARRRIILKYTLAAKNNARDAHLHAVKHFLGKPSGHPNPKMIERPIWSTWAKFKRDVNDQVVREFAQEILDHGYKDSQFELDDDWEVCYGALVFRDSKFSQINETVQWLKDNDFRVTLWIHPFVNIDCTEYTNIGHSNGFFAQNEEGSVLTQWWNSLGQDSQYIDFTNEEARDWFVRRLNLIKEKHGIDSFKFDAGETSWSPQVPVLGGDVELTPNAITVEYVRTCALFGDLVEVRTGWRTQDLPIFVRMIDKDTKWGHDNGLYTLITTLMQLNMNGYTMVLPDMIGGNGYNDTTPTAELFVRWLQANTFMPSIQFSFVPWDYNDTQIDVEAISRKFVDLHRDITPHILRAMEASIQDGHPVNAPIWWLDPDDLQAQKVDDEYLLGERYLVAPVIKEGATSRDVYLPRGVWKDHQGNTFLGPQLITNYPAPIDVLPYFENTSLNKITKA